jgi:hypothetical protein
MGVIIADWRLPIDGLRIEDCDCGFPANRQSVNRQSPIRQSPITNPSIANRQLPIANGQ